MNYPDYEKAMKDEQDRKTEDKELSTDTCCLLIVSWAVLITIILIMLIQGVRW